MLSTKSIFLWTDTHCLQHKGNDSNTEAPLLKMPFPKENLISSRSIYIKLIIKGTYNFTVVKPQITS